MSELSVIDPAHLIEQIKTRLAAAPHRSTYHHFKIAPGPTDPPAYTLIVGAGFSHGVVPLTRQLICETIGDYYVPDQDQSSLERPPRALEKHSASFWSEFNRASGQAGLPTVEVDRRGLPKDPGAAYRRLFEFEGANALFAQPEKPRKPSYLDRLRQQRGLPIEEPKAPPDAGRKFVRGFLRYVLDPGGEHGWGSTGRNRLNPAHRYLAKLLEAQQTGSGWTGAAFCRTIFTTNFDTLLQVALQQAGIVYLLTDRPEGGFDTGTFPDEEAAIHLVYTHGSILRHNPASAAHELSGLADRNVEILRNYLQSRDVITIGYGGWEDGLMRALAECDASRHRLYWCDVPPAPDSRLAEFLGSKGPGAVYVSLGKDGADGLMRGLYQALVSAPPEPAPHTP